MNILAVVIPVLSILIVKTNGGVVDHVYNGTAVAVNSTKEAIGSLFSFGKDLVFGKNNPYPDKETGHHNDGIVGGVMNTIHNGADFVRSGVSKVMDQEYSLRQKFIGIFKHDSNKDAGGNQGTHDAQLSQGNTNLDNKDEKPIYHYGEGLLDVRMTNNMNKDFTNSFDNTQKAKENSDENLKTIQNQLNSLTNNGKNGFNNMVDTVKSSLDKENEILSTVTNKINEGGVVFRDNVLSNAGSLDQLSYGRN